MQSEEVVQVLMKTKQKSAGAVRSAAASGLGLSIAKGFTEAFRGRIHADRVDELNGGTKVTICLPLSGATGAGS